jgi:hypothetical protein
MRPLECSGWMFTALHRHRSEPPPHQSAAASPRTASRGDPVQRRLALMAPQQPRWCLLLASRVPGPQSMVVRGLPTTCMVVFAKTSSQWHSSFPPHALVNANQFLHSLTIQQHNRSSANVTKSQLIPHPQPQSALDYSPGLCPASKVPQQCRSLLAVRSLCPHHGRQCCLQREPQLHHSPTRDAASPSIALPSEQQRLDGGACVPFGPPHPRPQPSMAG